jgi:hypothetical protein
MRRYSGTFENRQNTTCPHLLELLWRSGSGPVSMRMWKSHFEEHNVQSDRRKEKRAYATTLYINSLKTSINLDSPCRRS